MARSPFTLNKTARVPKFTSIKEELFEESRVNGGMITILDPADIPKNAAQLVRNGRVRDDKTSRRPGTVLLDPTKPDSNPVLELAYVKKNDGSPYTIRFTPSTVFIRNVSDWTQFTGTLNGTESDRFRVVLALDDVVFTNNGADNIKLIDFNANTFNNLGNAPAYRYITGFYNRVVGANLRGIDEAQIGWSADGDITEWDPLVNISAGNSPLVDSPSDLSDFITGIFGFTSVMIVMREKSIWLATKQPIASNPFYLYAAVPGVGSDAPDSIDIIPGGLVWTDTRTKSVWAYIPGNQPEAIGRPIENRIFNNVDDPGQIFASYNPIFNEYTTCIPQAGSKYVICYTYNFRTKAWVQEEYYDIKSIQDVQLATAGTTIDELGSVPIDSLIGTIDELSPALDVATVRSFGRGNGEVLVEDVTATVDVDHADAEDVPDFIFELVSKEFTRPVVDTYFTEIRIEYIFRVAGTFSLEYTKDNGKTWTIAKTVTPNVIGEPKLLKYKKNIKARRLAWRIFAQGSSFDILAYEVKHSFAGESDDD